MKKQILFIAFSILFLSAFADAQLLDKITRRCPSPNGSVYASILVQGNGDIRHTPCPSRASIFTGNVDFSGATLTGAVTGSGTVNFVPRWSAASALIDTPFSWNGTTYVFNDAALTATWRQELTPTSVGTGTYRVGHFGVNQTNVILTQSTNNASLNAGNGTNSASVIVDSDAFGVGNGFVNLSAQTIFAATALDWRYARTVTAGGTTGNQTINQPTGRVNFAAGAAALTVTNSTVTATSFVFALAQTNDATCAVKNVVPAAGSFVINMTANCTAETAVAFIVTN